MNYVKIIIAALQAHKKIMEQVYNNEKDKKSKTAINKQTFNLAARRQLAEHRYLLGIAVDIPES